MRAKVERGAAENGGGRRGIDPGTGQGGTGEGSPPEAVGQGRGGPLIEQGEGGGEKAFGAGEAGATFHFRPIGGIAVDQVGEGSEEFEAAPEVLRGVDTEDEEESGRVEDGDFGATKVRGAEVIAEKPPGGLSEAGGGDTGVEFDAASGDGMLEREMILGAEMDCAGGVSAGVDELVAKGFESVRGGRQVGAAGEQVEIVELAESQATVGLHRQDGTFERDEGDACLPGRLENGEEFASEGEVAGGDMGGVLAEGGGEFGRKSGECGARGEQRSQAVVVGESDDGVVAIRIERRQRTRCRMDGLKQPADISESQHGGCRSAWMSGASWGKQSRRRGKASRRRRVAEASRAQASRCQASEFDWTIKGARKELRASAAKDCWGERVSSERAVACSRR